MRRSKDGKWEDREVVEKGLELMAAALKLEGAPVEVQMAHFGGRAAPGPVSLPAVQACV